MPSAFPTWILFTCYFLNSWTWVSLGQRLSSPKASVQVIPSNVIAKGENFTIRCQGPLKGVRFHLYRDRNVIQSQDPPGNVAEFHFTNAQQQDSETYICRYNPTSDGAVYSAASDPIIIQVRDNYPKPSLEVSPGNVALRGETLTFTCKGERENMRFILRWSETNQLTEEPPGMEAVFTVRDVQYEGIYDCFYQPKTGLGVYSEPSESRQIRVLDLPKASISLEVVPGVKGDYKIYCSAPKDQNVKWFFLYEDGVEVALTDRIVPPGKHNMTFPVSKGNGNKCLRCRCSYQIIESGESVLSPLSDLLSLDDKTKKPDSTEKDDEERKETDSTEKASDKGHGGKDEKEITPKPTNTPTTIGQHTVIISIVCIAILLIVLVVATVLYRRRRSPKTKDDIQKKGLSSNEEKAEAAPETTYATIDKRKNPDNTNIPEVRESEGNEDQEELTYVTVSQKSLKKKRPAQPRSDEESTVYAAVNLH